MLPNCKDPRLAYCTGRTRLPPSAHVHSQDQRTCRCRLLAAARHFVAFSPGGSALAALHPSSISNADLLLPSKHPSDETRSADVPRHTRSGKAKGQERRGCSHSARARTTSRRTRPTALALRSFFMSAAMVTVAGANKAVEVVSSSGDGGEVRRAGQPVERSGSGAHADPELQHSECASVQGLRPSRGQRINWQRRELKQRRVGGRARGSIAGST